MFGPLIGPQPQGVSDCGHLCYYALSGGTKCITFHHSLISIVSLNVIQRLFSEYDSYNSTMKTALILVLLLEVFAGVSRARAFGEDTPPNMNGQYRDVSL